MGYRNPSVRPVLPDAIEALIGVGELDAADPLVDELEERGRELDNPWAIATATRCRGMLEAARGDLSAAVVTLERAMVEHERAASPFERGRTLLVLGQVERRAKRRRAAREALDAALAIFDELPAPLWAEKARAELARISGRRPASEELTETERRVAELVAEGRSNPEVAAALFITRQTVEKHLTRIYAKLGVRSRVELARRFAAEERARA
jgi:DNA-binding CsgD family transcriptional regulator